MAMTNRRVLKNGDVLRVIKNNSGRWLKSYLIQAKEKGKNRYYVIGDRDSLVEAIQEMNRRADEIDKGAVIAWLKN